MSDFDPATAPRPRCCQPAEECDAVVWNTDAGQWWALLYTNAPHGPPVYGPPAVACLYCGERLPDKPHI